MPPLHKPSPTDLAAILQARRLDATAAGLAVVCLPLAILLATAVGLPLFFIMAFVFLAFGLYVPRMAVASHVRKARERLVAQRFRDHPGSAPRFAVHCTFTTGLRRTTDAGILWREGDTLMFEGLQTQIAIPSEASAEPLPIPGGSRNVYLQLNRGPEAVQVAFEAATEEIKDLREFVDDWNRAQPYRDVTVPLANLNQGLGPGSARLFWHVGPCVLFALYLVLAGPLPLAQILLYTSFTAVGFAHFWFERRKLFGSL